MDFQKGEEMRKISIAAIISIFVCGVSAEVGAVSGSFGGALLTLVFMFDDIISAISFY